MDNNFDLSAKSLGERLKKVREQHKMSRDQMAELFEVSRSAIQAYEYGERSPNADYLSKYFKYFGTNLHWLLTGDMLAVLGTTNGKIGSPHEETILHLTRQLNPRTLTHLIDFLMSIQGIKTN